MRGDYRILVIDDNSQRGQELKLLLDFMGEPAVVADCTNWHNIVGTANEFLSVIIGQCKPNASIPDLLTDLQAWGPEVPILLLGEQLEHKDIPQKFSRCIAGTITLPAKYAQALDALHYCQIWQENYTPIRNKNSERSIPMFRSLAGVSPAIQNVKNLMEQVAESDATVLILGESGTGKEVVARNLHYHSPRRDKPFVPVNCGAIPAELLESELFGHEKGAFTGAHTARQGRFELAKGGTLFLDEIGDMPLAMQIKILRVLQERHFERVGSNKVIEADVHIIAATHRNLEAMIENGTFREDLYYRLNVFPIEMPPLRERIEDIPLLLNELITRIEVEGRGTVKVLPRAVNALCQYPWPGNVRELANLVERLAILYPRSMVDIKDLPQKFNKHLVTEASVKTNFAKPIIVKRNDEPVLPKTGLDLKEHLMQTEVSLIKQALSESNGVVSKAASYLNMRRTTLVEKMRKYDLSRPEKSCEYDRNLTDLS